MARSQASLEILGNLVGDDRLPVLFKTVQDLTQRVGTTPFALKDVSFGKEGQEVEIFGAPVTVDANLDAAAKIHDAGDAVDLFGTGGGMTAPPGTSFADFSVEAGAGASTELPFQSQFSLTFTGGVQAGFEYRHLLPVQSSEKRLEALKDLIAGTRLPGMIDPRALARGEGHRFFGRLNLDLGLKGQFGGELDLDKVVEIFDDLPVELQAHIEYSLQASVGYSLYGDMELAIARHPDSDMVRLRLERSRKSDLTLGARVALQAEYDFGSTSLIKILDDALAQDSAQEILSAMTEVQGVLGQVGEGNWEAIVGDLSDRAGESLQKFVDSETHWKDWLDNSAEVTQVLALSKKVVDTFNSVDATVQSWWNDLLGSVGLGNDSKIRVHLQRIAAIDPDNFDVGDLLTGDLGQAVDLVETLTGKEIQDFFLDSNDGVKEALGRAQKIAAQALGVLGDLPNGFLTRFHSFAEKTGIQDAVNFLAANATSKAEIEAKIEARIKNLAERLVRKAWDRIDDDDLRKIQVWAQKMQGILGHVETIEQDVRKYLKKLKGDVGFSIGLEWQRTTEKRALIDLDFDPTVRSVRKAVEGCLATRNAKELLAGLPDSDSMDDGHDIEDLPYMLREASFSSRRVRHSSALLSWFGKKSNRRIDEAKVEVRQDGRKFTRTGSYSAGFTRTLDINDGFTGNGSIWFQAQAGGAGKDLDAPYSGPSNGKPKLGMRWTFDRTDFKTTVNEVSALDDLLEEFGFVDGNERPCTKIVPDKVQTRFTMAVQLDDKAVEGYFQDVDNEDDWDDRYVLAARRWYLDTLVDRTLEDRNVRLGQVNSALVIRPDFRSVLRRPLVPMPSPFDRWADTRIEDLEVGGQTGRISVVPSTPHHGLSPKASLRSLIFHRGKGFNKHRDVLPLFNAAVANPSHASLSKLVRKTSTAFRAAAAGNWNNPMFCVWLARIRILTNARDSLAVPNVKGVAMLQWRADSTKDWSEPMSWKLKRSLS